MKQQFLESLTAKHFIKGNGWGHMLTFLSATYIICHLGGHHSWEDFKFSLTFNPFLYAFVTFGMAFVAAMFFEFGAHFKWGSPVSWADAFSSAYGAVLGICMYWYDQQLTGIATGVFVLCVVREYFRLKR